MLKIVTILFYFLNKIRIESLFIKIQTALQKSAVTHNLITIIYFSVNKG